jgi:hypothetical protein
MFPGGAGRKRSASSELTVAGALVRVERHSGIPDERGGLDMDDTATQQLTDEEIRTVMPGSSASPKAETDPDKMDGDGMDGDATDKKDGDAADQDGTDGKDADGTDTGDMDGTDSTS